jgi:hypothetical protein
LDPATSPRSNITNITTLIYCTGVLSDFLLFCIQSQTTRPANMNQHGEELAWGRTTGHLDGSGRRKETDGYKKENTNRRSISDHTERGLRASKGSRMISRGSLPFLAASQAQQAGVIIWPKHLVALGLVFLSSTHLNRAKREVIQKSITSQSPRPFSTSHPTLRTIFLHLLTPVLDNHS